MTTTFTTMTTTFTAEQAHAAAAKGAAWLDEHCPDWFDKIDLSKFDIQHPSRCVLGQTAGCIIEDDALEAGLSGYWRIMHWMFKDYSWGPFSAWAKEHGFDAPGVLIVEYEMLDIAWRELIRERRQALVPA